MDDFTESLLDGFDEWKVQVGNRAYEAAMSEGYTIARLSRTIKASQDAIQKWKKGQPPGLPNIYALSKLLKINPREFFPDLFEHQSERGTEMNSDQFKWFTSQIEMYQRKIADLESKLYDGNSVNDDDPLKGRNVARK